MEVSPEVSRKSSHESNRSVKSLAKLSINYDYQEENLISVTRTESVVDKLKSNIKDDLLSEVNGLVNTVQWYNGIICIKANEYIMLL